MHFKKRRLTALVLLLLSLCMILIYHYPNAITGGRLDLGLQNGKPPVQLHHDCTMPRYLSGTASQRSMVNVSVSGVCSSPQCIAAFESQSNSWPQRIPTIRHILWKSDKVSSYFARQLKTWADIHPGWKYILWRDSDLDAFVARHYTGALGKFRSLPKHIMRVDMVRYMILHRFGGVYADLDYVLVRPLDRFLKFPAVATRSPEPHALLFFGIWHWPAPVLGSPAFMMSEPQHPFFNFCIMQLVARPVDSTLQFAGPLGLSDMMVQYQRDFPATDLPDGIVYVPASRSFSPMDDNSMRSSTSKYKNAIIQQLNDLCQLIANSTTVARNLTAYCADVTNLDPITDPNEPVYAVHDSNKSRSSYDERGSREFQNASVAISSVLPNLVMADTLY